MGLYSGKTGYIKLGTNLEGTIIAHMSSFSLEMSTEIIEVISFGNTYKEKIPSVMDWSASADGRCDFETANGQAELLTAYNNGDLVTIAMALTSTIFFEGTCYIESLTIDSDSADSPTISISFAGSNAVVFTDSTPAG